MTAPPLLDAAGLAAPRLEALALRQADGDRPSLRHPWTIRFRGAPATVVSNGAFLLTVPGHLGFPPAADAAKAPPFELILDTMDPISHGTTTLAQLRAALQLPPDPGPCDRCQWDGRFCAWCGAFPDEAADHEVPLLDACWIAGLPINRTLLRGALAELPTRAEPIVVSTWMQAGKPALVLEAYDWMLTAMALRIREPGDYEGADRYPLTLFALHAPRQPQ